MEIIGYLAGILTASTMIPQIIKSIRTRHARDLSIYMILIYIFNAGLWVLYGISIHAAPLMLADSFAFGAGLTQLVLKLKFGQNEN
jgi:MtN3 and saliva related transmembrane protein